jgi:hypothetical protein
VITSIGWWCNGYILSSKHLSNIILMNLIIDDSSKLLFEVVAMPIALSWASLPFVLLLFLLPCLAFLWAAMVFFISLA